MRNLLLASAAVILLSGPAYAGSASTTLTTSYPSSAVPTVVQNALSHGVASMNPNGNGGSSQVCTWTLSQPIGAGHAVVLYNHMADTTDTYPWNAVSITLSGNGAPTQNFTLSPYVIWTPFPEPITLATLRNVQGNPNLLTYNNEPTPGGGGGTMGFCDSGVTEYAGVTGITVVNPALVGGTTPSLTITPPAPALIWAFASPFENDSAGALISPSTGYSLLINDLAGDDLGVWGSDALVPASPLTLTWSAPQGAYPPGCSFDSPPYRPCPTVVMAAALY